MTAPLPNARQKVWVLRVLVDDYYKHMPRVTVDVARLRTLTAQWPWVPSIICSSSPVMVKTLYQWKNLEWDLESKTKTKKQIIMSHVHMNFCDHNWLSLSMKFTIFSLNCIDFKINAMLFIFWYYININDLCYIQIVFSNVLHFTTYISNFMFVSS